MSKRSLIANMAKVSEARAALDAHDRRTEAAREAGNFAAVARYREARRALEDELRIALGDGPYERR